MTAISSLVVVSVREIRNNRVYRIAFGSLLKEHFTGFDEKRGIDRPDDLSHVILLIRGNISQLHGSRRSAARIEEQQSEFSPQRERGT